MQKTKRIIREHHEHLDGKGYPSGLQGKDISLDVRILAVAEAYDAMMSDRPYRKALSKEDALRELKESVTTIFDKNVVDTLITILEEEA